MKCFEIGRFVGVVLLAGCGVWKLYLTPLSLDAFFLFHLLSQNTMYYVRSYIKYLCFKVVYHC